MKKVSRLLIILFLLNHSSSALAINLEEATWNEIVLWKSDDFSQSLLPFKRSCQVLQKQKSWQSICQSLASLNMKTSTEIRQFYEQNFTPFRILDNNQHQSGLITGYYVPMLKGSLQADNQYKYPIYSKPEEPHLIGMSRQEIEQKGLPKKNILAWTDDPFLLFFLHVQGSGNIQLPNGQIKHLQYASNNGYDYTSLGGVLIRQKIMKKEDITLQSLLNWMRNNPSQARQLMNENKRYIFFSMQASSDIDTQTRGSMNVPLTAQRSIAIDPKNIPQGYPLWLETTLPQKNNQAIPFHRLMFAQDTGAAIKGAIRADVFFGTDDDAEFYAGNMKQNGQLFLLKPKQ